MNSSSGPTPRAQNRYRQVRLTFTQEANGRLSYSIYAKPMNKAWDQHQVIVRDQVRYDGRLDCTEDVVRALLVILGERFLPGHIG